MLYAMLVATCFQHNMSKIIDSFDLINCNILLVNQINNEEIIYLMLMKMHELNVCP